MAYQTMEVTIECSLCDNTIYFKTDNFNECQRLINEIEWDFDYCFEEGGTWTCPNHGDEMLVISYDIDGTLENGEPSGPIKADEIKHHQSKGNIVGSCSQNDIWEQAQTWEELGITPDFMVLKDARNLRIVQNTWPDASLYIHIGDWVGLDDVIAKQAGWKVSIVSA